MICIILPDSFHYTAQTVVWKLNVLMVVTNRGRVVGSNSGLDLLTSGEELDFGLFGLES